MVFQDVLPTTPGSGRGIRLEFHERLRKREEVVAELESLILAIGVGVQARRLDNALSVPSASIVVSLVFFP